MWWSCERMIAHIVLYRKRVLFREYPVYKYSNCTRMYKYYIMYYYLLHGYIIYRIIIIKCVYAVAAPGCTRM